MKALHTNIPHSSLWGVRLLFFAALWLWASWWMGDTFRICYENSYFVADAEQMRFLLQQQWGWLYAIGRALLMTMRYVWLGGLLLAVMLCTSCTMLARILRLPLRWRWLSALPATAWMTWVAWRGLNLYYQSEPGCTFGWLVLVWVVILAAFIIVPSPSPTPAPTEEAEVPKVKQQHKGKQPVPARKGKGLVLASAAIILLCLLLLPILTTHLRHPYQRPVTKMQVQMLHQDWEAMAQTGHDNAELSYRPLAAFYAIALVHTGHLGDQMFDIRMDYDSLYLTRYGGQPDLGTNYYIIDCDYHAGMFRPATRKAMEHLTMQGPTLYSLKHLAKLALLENDWALARKYLHILRQQPFESEFTDKYWAMLDNAEAVKADKEFATVLQTVPLHDDFEGMYQEPFFLGYNAVRVEFQSSASLIQSLIVNLYSKRMPPFLERTQPFVGSTPPKSIAEGLITQSIKNPAIMQAFPSLSMEAQTYRNFIQAVQNDVKDRPAHARELFDRWKGYYPYYYLFGNLRATRPSAKTSPTDNGAVN